MVPVSLRPERLSDTQLTGAATQLFQTDVCSMVSAGGGGDGGGKIGRFAGAVAAPASAASQSAACNIDRRLRAHDRCRCQRCGSKSLTFGTFCGLLTSLRCACRIPTLCACQIPPLATLCDRARCMCLFWQSMRPCVQSDLDRGACRDMMTSGQRGDWRGLFIVVYDYRV